MIRVDNENVTVSGKVLTILAELGLVLGSVYDCIKDGRGKSFALKTIATAIISVINYKEISVNDVLEAIRTVEVKVDA